FGEAGDAKHLLSAEPGGLAVFEAERGLRADADGAVVVEVADVGFEQLAAPAGKLFERQQVIGREGFHRGSGHRSGGRTDELWGRPPSNAPGTGPTQNRGWSANGPGRPGGRGETVGCQTAVPSQRAGLAQPPVRL